MSIIISAIIFIALAIASVVIAKIADEPITWAIAHLLGGFGPRRTSGVRGTWKNSYSFQNPDGRKYVEQIVQLRQFGSYVIGKAITSSTDVQKHRIRGRYRSRVLTGTWENVAEGAEHYGAFQLVLRTDGNVMAGQWVGFDRRNRVQHGEWKWELLNRSLDKRSTAQLLKRSS